ncbi:MAG: hypothetical protein JRC68_01610 [Deltaproteobacteria bacterium]|nr:hypothetical protein [Deltaproteobacteria bacterium]
MALAESVANPQEFRGVNPKHLTTAKVSGIFKRYRLEETGITSLAILCPP